MKKKLFMLGMFGKAMVIAVLAFGLVVIGCDSGNSNKNNGGNSGNSVGSASTPPVETVSTIAGLAYSQKVGTGDHKHYLLSVTYENALSTLTSLWGAPLTGWSLWRNTALSENPTNATVIFEETPSDYRLCKYVSNQWVAVGWEKSY